MNIDPLTFKFLSCILLVIPLQGKLSGASFGIVSHGSYGLSVTSILMLVGELFSPVSLHVILCERQLY